VFGQLTGNHPLFFLAVYAPAIAAFSIILRRAGIRGLSRYLTRLFLWRCSSYWYAFLLVGLPLVFYGGSAWKGNLTSEPFPFSSAGALATALVLGIIKGPVEEFGWRGFALPLLQRKMAPVWAALVIGVVWGGWHLPAFLLSGTQQSAWSFSAFFAGTIAISLIMTPLFNASRGSILLAAFMHFQLMNPIWPDAQPYDTYILILVALFVVVLNRRTVFSRVGAVTRVIPDADS
jgi:membrane protease YdiL (CAAX protease family)